MPGMFTRLRERRIVQIVLSVAAGGWILLEAVNSLIERGILPDPVFRIGLVVYLGGIVASVIAGWHHGEKGRQEVTRGEVIQLGVVGLLTVAVAGTIGFRAVRRAENLSALNASTMDLHRIAVLYFQDLSGFGELQYLADALTEGLIDDLDRVRALDVVSRNGSERFRGSSLPSDGIARALEAGTLVDGSLERRSGGLRVNVRLIDGQAGATLQRGVFDAPADDPDALSEDLAREVSRLLREWLGDEIELRRTRAETSSNAAWLLVQRGERALKEANESLAHDDAHGVFQGLAAADSLAAEAERLDPDWAEPAVLRAQVAYRISRLAGDAHEAAEAIDLAVSHADRALDKAPGEARAQEYRGSALYFRWLIGLDHDPEVRDRLLDRARTDLETAVRNDPTLASAYSTLSHLYYQIGDIPNVVLAARSAYEEDAFLEVANDVLWRLFLGSYDMEQFSQAARWCDEGSRRFPEYYRFAECHLWMMTTPTVEPAPDAAWRLLARMDSLTPAPLRPTQSPRGRMIVAGVLARAAGNDPALADSARSVMVSARAGHDVDPLQELASMEAFMRTLLGDRDTAVELLQRYVAGNPEHAFRRGETHWWWRHLRDHPGFSSITESGR